MLRQCLHAIASAGAPAQAVLSPEAAHTDDLSAEHTAYVTRPACPDNVCTHLPVQVHQVLAALLLEAVDTDDSSANTTAHVTAHLCPDNVCT